MILVECVTFALISRSYLVAAIAAVAAVIALPDHRRISLTRNQALAALAVAGVLVAIPHLLGLYTLFGPRGTVFDTFGIMWFFADVCLVVQAALLFFAPEEDSPQRPVPYPRTFVLLGAVAMVGTGVVRANSGQQVLYGLLATAFVVAALVFGAPAQGASRARSPRPVGAHAIQFAVLVAALSAGAAGSSLIATYGNEIDQYLAGAISDHGTRHTIGFSRTSRLDSIRQIRDMDETIVLRVYSDTDPGYLRACAYAVYEDGRWEHSLMRRELNPLDSSVSTIPKDSARNTYQIHEIGDAPLDSLDVWQDNSLNDALFLPLHAALVQVRARGMSVDENNALIPEGLDTSLPITAHAPRVHVDAEPSAEQRRLLLEIPTSIESGVKALALEKFQAIPDTDRMLLAIQDYFRTGGFQYGFGIELPQGRDPVSYFLTERPPAHCEFFASGAVILLRVAGIPARYVTGFVAADYNPYGRYWVARNADSHAWAEAYIEGKGWVVVEVTPAEGVPSPRKGLQFARAYDALGQRWREVRMVVATRGLGRAALDAIVRVINWLLAPLGVPLLLAMAVLVSIYFSLHAASRRRGPRSLSPELRGLHRILSRQDRKMRRKGLRRGESETLHAFATRIEREFPALADDARWYRRCAEVRYGGAPISEESLAELRALPR